MMRNPGNAVKSFGMMLFIAAAFMMGAAGCQSLMALPGNGMVDEDYWVPLRAGGRQAGVWDGMYVEIRYDYVRDGGRLSLKGEVRYASRILDNYSLIQFFHLDVLFLDPQGKVLETQPFASDAYDTLLPGALEPTVPFNRDVILPANTAAMAFSYKGQAIASGEGTGSPRYFWEFPVH